ncbi:hypothetical protein RDWZM_010072 [Blomia tropicalis]|uniref:Chitin-binding type-2 domain-containing protein n=1 Tax=Blomia tropicalis TaxID=40697 RepID=A0A9Q0LYH5_BLOTA|nr:hypothetical protein RDWZM_010072 [Blomia tropicalis]
MEDQTIPDEETIDSEPESKPTTSSDYIQSSLKARIHLMRPNANSFNINLEKITSMDRLTNETAMEMERQQPTQQTDKPQPSVVLLLERETMLSKIRKNGNRNSIEWSNESNGSPPPLPRTRRRQSRPTIHNRHNNNNNNNFILKQHRTTTRPLHMETTSSSTTTTLPTTTLATNLMESTNISTISSTEFETTIGTIESNITFPSIENIETTTFSTSSPSPPPTTTASTLSTTTTTTENDEELKLNITNVNIEKEDVNVDNNDELLATTTSSSINVELASTTTTDTSILDEELVSMSTTIPIPSSSEEDEEDDEEKRKKKKTDIKKSSKQSTTTRKPEILILKNKTKINFSLPKSLKKNQSIPITTTISPISIPTTTKPRITTTVSTISTTTPTTTTPNSIFRVVPNQPNLNGGKLAWNIWSPSSTLKPNWNQRETSTERRAPGVPKIPNNFGFANTIRDRPKWTDDSFANTAFVPNTNQLMELLSHIPDTSFDCSIQQYPGFYSDMEVGCQVYHSCSMGSIGRRRTDLSQSNSNDGLLASASTSFGMARKIGSLNGAKHSFLCPNGTIFSQEYLICDWWYNVKCEESPRFYPLNRDVFTTGQQTQTQTQSQPQTQQPQPSESTLSTTSILANSRMVENIPRSIFRV